MDPFIFIIAAIVGLFAISFFVPMIIICIGTLSYAVYWFFTPLDLVKDLTNVSYQHVYQNEKYRQLPKCHLVQEYRKKRCIGQVPPVYPNGWFALIDSDQLKCGQLKYISALGEHFALFRTLNGTVYILNSFCSHLGANIAVGGIVIDDCIQCPFHGWRFSGKDGKCVNIPYTKNIPKNSEIQKWHSYEVNSLIFIWYHAEKIDPLWYPQPIDVIEQKKWWYRGRNEYYVNCHIQEIPENGADVTHLSILHGAFVFAGSDLVGMNCRWAKFAKHVWQASWSASNEPEKEHIGTMTLHHGTVLFGFLKTFAMDVKTYQVGPGYVEMNIETTIGPMKILQTVTPIEPLLQKVVHKVFYPLHMSLYGTITFFTERILFERDVIIWNHKLYRSNPLLTKEELSINKHRKWYNQFYSSHSVRFHNNVTDW